MLNRRLETYFNENNILNENQAGFRRMYSTNDHIFLLKCIVDLFLWKKRKLYCVFIDYKRAFDSVWRVGLWRKLIKVGIEGKFIMLLKTCTSK
jgi:hypothetical protein